MQLRQLIKINHLIIKYMLILLVNQCVGFNQKANTYVLLLRKSSFMQQVNALIIIIFQFKKWQNANLFHFNLIHTCSKNIQFKADKSQV